MLIHEQVVLIQTVKHVEQATFKAGNNERTIILIT